MCVHIGLNKQEISENLFFHLDFTDGIAERFSGELSGKIFILFIQNGFSACCSGKDDGSCQKESTRKTNGCLCRINLKEDLYKILTLFDFREAIKVIDTEVFFIC